MDFESQNPGSGGATGSPPAPTGGPADAPRAPRREARLVRYGAMGWVGEFAIKPNAEVPYTAAVVIQTERGIELGEQVGAPCTACSCEAIRPQMQTYVRNSGPEFCLPRAGRILRLANEQDVNEQRHLNAHVHEDIASCAELTEQLGLDMKIVTAEHLLGGERIVFYFRSPARVDFRQLVKELAQRHRTRIEMRQVGARDEARLVADYEICGRECCCKNFLKKLRPVNMKMAKLQKSTLDPSKVSGRCGRLRCCLRYEHLGYEELIQRLPRLGSRVMIDAGPATVLDRQILTQLVSLRTDDDRLIVVPVEEIRSLNAPPPRPESGPPGSATERPERPGRGRRDRGPMRPARPDAPERREARGPRPDEPERREAREPSRSDAPERREPREPLAPEERTAPESPAPPASRFEPEGPVLPLAPAGGESPPAPTGPTPTDGPPGGGARRRRRRRRRTGRGPSSPPSAGSGETA